MGFLGRYFWVFLVGFFGGFFLGGFFGWVFYWQPCAKVVEMISVMLKRNSRCKLTSDDVLFLQRPNAPPNAVVQFTVHVNAIQYLPAVAYYLRQNMIYASGGH